MRNIKKDSPEDKTLVINIDDLNNLKTLNFNSIEKLILSVQKKSNIISPHIDLSSDFEVAKEDIEMLDKLCVLKKFSNLKRLYFVNIYLSGLPKEIEFLNKLEILQINYYRHFDVYKEKQKIEKLKKLNDLIINEFFLEESKVSNLRFLLPNIKIEDL